MTERILEFTLFVAGTSLLLQWLTLFGLWKIPEIAEGLSKILARHAKVLRAQNKVRNQIHRESIEYWTTESEEVRKK